MTNLGPLNVLRLPLQVLWEFPDIARKMQQEVPELETEFRQWFSKYDAPTQHHLRTQLAWALAHPDYDFQAMLKGVKTSNADILSYFRFLQQVFPAV